MYGAVLSIYFLCYLTKKKKKRFQYSILYLWSWSNPMQSFCANVSFSCQHEKHFLIVVCTSRKDGQDTQDELQKRNLREELEERERRHFSSKDKSYNGKKRNISILPKFVGLQHLIVDLLNLPHLYIVSTRYFFSILLFIQLTCMLLQMKEVAGRKAISYWKVNLPAHLTCISIQ